MEAGYGGCQLERYTNKKNLMAQLGGYNITPVYIVPKYTLRKDISSPMTTLPDWEPGLGWAIVILIT